MLSIILVDQRGMRDASDGKQLVMKPLIKIQDTLYVHKIKFEEEYLTTHELEL